jgi:hypothetical protein
LRHSFSGRWWKAGAPPGYRRASCSAAHVSRSAAHLDLALAPVFVHIAGLFKVGIPPVRLYGGLLWIGAELVRDIFRFCFHDAIIALNRRARSPKLAQHLAYFVTASEPLELWRSKFRLAFANGGGARQAAASDASSKMKYGSFPQYLRRAYHMAALPCARSVKSRVVVHLNLQPIDYYAAQIHDRIHASPALH